MALEARIRIAHQGCFTQRLTLEGAQLAGDRDADVFVLHGEPRLLDAHHGAIAAARGRAPEVVSRTTGALVLRAPGAPHAVPAAIAAAGCTLLWPALFAGGEETYAILAPSQERLDALVVALAAHGHVRVERVSEARPSALHVSVPLAEMTRALTERQLIVLQRAIADGYYDSPRRTSTEALAAAFGVTRSTIEEHLRKAERRVLEGFATILAAQPVLAHAAARKPGRPPRDALPHARPDELSTGGRA